jgi:tetratricopeptide (TPR) repeat protein
MTNISQKEIDHLHNLIGQSVQEALELFRNYEQRYADDADFRNNRGTFMIDIGSALKDSALVQQGIQLTEQVLLSIEDKLRPTFQYNLGNGYYAVHAIERRKQDFSFNPDTTSLIKAKKHYRDALRWLEHLGNNLRAQLHINYGNCLSGLGRSIEAISEYNAALIHVPDHPMAWGNLGVKLERFAYISRYRTHLFDAYEALNKALTGTRLEEIGESRARSYFNEVRAHIETILNKIKKESGHSSEPEMSVNTSAHHQGYIKFCIKYQLFLNFCLMRQSREHMTEDSVRFSMVTAYNDNTTFPRLSRVVNEVKERYAAARLLAYEAINMPFDTQPYDEMTFYVDILDYAVYGIRVAKLKLAFESAYNILDKIAFFIKDYLRLEMSEKNIYFHTIWKKDNKFRNEILDRKNYHLYGLYDISRDLQKGNYLSHLREIRNHLTHRYLVPHIEKIDWLTSVDSPEYHLGYRELLDRTIELLQLVRSAVIYLIAFIDQEERGKGGKENIHIVPQVLPPYRYYPFGPMDGTV